MSKIFWRSKEGRTPPLNAQFSLWPFAGGRVSLKDHAILPSLPPACPPISIRKRIDTPDRDHWLRTVEKALQEIERGTFKKVVLARETTFHLEQAPDPFSVTALLEKKAKGATLFCIELDKDKAFLGATPERLIQRTDTTVTVEAIAGTRKRGKTEQENLQLETELLTSEKDQREFRFVQNYFEEMLGPHCIRPLEFSPVGLHKTANVHHLMARASGELSQEISDTSLVEWLHPSPALCGTPKKTAFEWIHAHEPFQRGLYGGIIGWETDRESDWMVAIRSCMLEGSIARLYTGTGIVAGSNPESEWEELEAKISLYSEIFR